MDLLSSTPTLEPALAARQLYYHSQLMAPAMPPMPELIASPEPLFLQWQQGGHYLPATELGGVLGAHTHEPAAVIQPAISPSVLLGLCNEALGQDCVDLSSSKGLGHGQYWNTTTCGSDLSSNKTDAVSAVIRDDEKARLGLLHHGFGAAAAAATSAPLDATPVQQAAAADASTAMLLLPSPALSNVVAAAATTAVLTDQLQGTYAMTRITHAALFFVSFPFSVRFSRALAIFGSRGRFCASSGLRTKDQMKSICKTFLWMNVIFRDESNGGN